MNTLQPARILIVDDEPNIRHVLSRSLRDPNYALTVAADGEEALHFLQQYNYDLLLLDLQMHAVSGLQVLRTARQKDPDVVAIILTAHGSLESAVEALRMGAFDYLFKPASPEAIRTCVRQGLLQRSKILQQRGLIAQVEAIKRLLLNAETPQPAAPQERFVQSLHLTLDRFHRTAAINNRPLDLTTSEFDILLQLVSAAPQPVSAQVLAQHALGYECSENEAREIIKWHIHHLRKKIENNPAQPHFIKTVRHRGYLWADE